MLKAVFFDLDGTLLPMDENEFTKGYFKLLIQKFAPRGYSDPKLFLDTMWKGVYAMYKNDGKRPNSEVFWDAFCATYGEKSRQDIPVFDAFYSHEFLQAKSVVRENPYAKEIISYCQKNFSYTVLSTNPIFPAVAQESRLGFIGLTHDDFTYVTDYDNSSYCKPNPMFFKALLDRFNLKPEEVIVFGNNTYEDGDCASALGIKVYLIKGFIIHSEKAKGTYEEIEMKDVISVLEKEKQSR